MMTASVLFLAASLSICLAVSYSGIPPDSRFDPHPLQSIYCSDQTRINVLTEKIVRVEHRTTQAQAFRDDASLMVINRNPGRGVRYTVANTSTWCNVSLLHHASAGITHVAFQKQASGSCAVTTSGDVRCSGACARATSSSAPRGQLHTPDVGTCCQACIFTAGCTLYVYHFNATADNCFLLTGSNVVGTKAAAHVVHASTRGLARGQIVVDGTFLNGSSWTYTYGNEDTGNLLGTLAPTPSADLAGCCNNSGGWDARYPLEDGLLSTSGWTVLDDSTTPLMDTDGWIRDDPDVYPHVDMYVLGCGDDYIQCLSDVTAISGNISIPPLHTFGVWWSRHWGDSFDGQPFGDMTEQAIKSEVVDGYRAHSLPLHVVVLDMEWHTMLASPHCNTFIGKAGWGGYTWNETLFSNVSAFKEYLRDNHLKLALNFHPDEGIDSCQQMYQALAHALGVDVSGSPMLPDFNQQQRNRTYVQSYFDLVIASTAVDISWPDSPQVTTWTNILWDSYQSARGLRPLTFSRYGGLGSHRAPVGFSGDTLRRWDTLAYEIYMTPKASNVLFPYWSHDIGGFSGAEVDSAHHTEAPELFLRWLQFACFAPVFRTHCRYCEQRIWTFGDTWYAMMKRTMVLRNALVPYIYTAANEAFNTGVGLLRPMYYHSKLPESYMSDQQYYFGGSIIAAPVAHQCVNSSGLPCSVTHDIFVPEGEWTDMSTGELVRGPAHYKRTTPLAETAWYVLRTHMVPLRTADSTHAALADPVVWLAHADAGQGIGSLYEDDGTSMEFVHGISRTTMASFVSDAQNATIRISSSGSFARGSSRSHHLALLCAQALPKQATCNGETAQVEMKPMDSFGIGLDALYIACTASPAGDSIVVDVVW